MGKEAAASLVAVTMRDWASLVSQRALGFWRDKVRNGPWRMKWCVSWTDRLKWWRKS